MSFCSDGFDHYFRYLLFISSYKILLCLTVYVFTFDDYGAKLLYLKVPP